MYAGPYASEEFQCQKAIVKRLVLDKNILPKYKTIKEPVHTLPHIKTLTKTREKYG